MRGQALQDAQVWIRGKKLDADDYRFLAASKELKQRETQQAIEAEQTRTALEAEKQANQILADAARKAERRIRVGVATLISTIILSSVLGLLASQYSRQSKESDIRASATFSQSNFTSGQGLDSLIEALKAARGLTELPIANPYTQDSVQSALQQSFYNLREFNRLEGHTSRAMAVSVNLDGLIASAEANGKIRLWQPDGQLVSDFSPDEKRHESAIASLSFTPDGQTIVSTGSDHLIKFWNLSGQQLDTLPGSSSGVTHISMSPDGKYLAAGESNGTLRLWKLDLNNLDRQKPVWSLDKAFDKSVSAVSFSPDGKTIAASSNAEIRQWTLDGTLRGKIDNKTDVSAISYSPNGQILAAVGNFGSIKLWYRSGSLLKLKEFPVQERPVRAVLCSGWSNNCFC